MKRIFLLLVLACTTLWMNAQDITFVQGTTAIAQGDTLLLYGNPDKTEIANLNVRNNTNAAISGAYATCHNLTDGGVIEVASLCFGACLPGDVSPEITVAANSTADGPLLVDLDVPATAQTVTTELFHLTAGTNRDYDNMASIYIKVVVHPLSIDETDGGIQMNAQPNPASHQVSIRYNVPADGRLVIYSVTGVKVKSIPLTEAEDNIEVDISDLSAGVYAYGIESAGLRASMKKLVVR